MKHILLGLGIFVAIVLAAGWIILIPTVVLTFVPSMPAVITVPLIVGLVVAAPLGTGIALLSFFEERNENSK